MSFHRHKLKSQITLGKKLAAARRRKKLTIEEAEVATKIRDKFLRALEADDYRALPGRIYAIGYVARYGEFLGIEPGRAVEQFRRESEVFLRQSGDLWPIKSKIAEPRIVVTPKIMIIAISIIVVIVLFGYIGYEVKKFSQPPPIEIYLPQAETTTMSKIDLVGKTSPTARLTINGQDVPPADDGTFHENIALHKGLNTIEIRAKSRTDKETVKVVRVYAELP